MTDGLLSGVFATYPGIEKKTRVRRITDANFRLSFKNSLLSESPDVWLGHLRSGVDSSFASRHPSCLSHPIFWKIIMKKTVLLASLLAAFALTACGKKEEAPVAPAAPAVEQPAPAAAPVEPAAPAAAPADAAAAPAPAADPAAAVAGAVDAAKEAADKAAAAAAAVAPKQ